MSYRPQQIPLFLKQGRRDGYMITKKQIVRAFQDALRQAMPEHLIKASVRRCGNRLQIFSKTYHLNNYKKIHLLGSGKASPGMARALAELLQDRLAGGMVVSNHPGTILNGMIDVFESTHPLPTGKSIKAAEHLMRRLQAVAADDLYIYVLSGGNSALVEKPLPPVTLQDIQATTRALLRSGAPIQSINVIRKHLSMVKGGRLGGLTKAQGIVLVISDVIGDDLETIGSAPFYGDRSTYNDAHDILLRYQVWNRIPASVRSSIRSGLSGLIEETPPAPRKNIDHVIVGSNRDLLYKIKARIESLGVPAHIMSSQLKGEAREAARALVAIGKEIIATGNPFKRPVCLLFGGETTVTVKGTGRGGRNQELCLAALREIGDMKNLIILSAGSDGIDGNSEAAGAVGDCSTLRKARKLGLDMEKFLNNNDSGGFFEKTGGLIQTGPTGTNVMDIIIMAAG